MIKPDNEVYLLIGDIPVGYQVHQQDAFPTPDSRLKQIDIVAGTTNVAPIYSTDTLESKVQTPEFFWGRAFRRLRPINVYMMNIPVYDLVLGAGLPNRFVAGNTTFDNIVNTIKPVLKKHNAVCGGVVFFSTAANPLKELAGIEDVQNDLEKTLGSKPENKKMILLSTNLDPAATYTDADRWGKGVLVQDSGVVLPNMSSQLLDSINNFTLSDLPILPTQTDMLSSTLIVAGVSMLALGISFLVPILHMAIPYILALTVCALIGFHAVVCILFSLIIGVPAGFGIYKMFFYNVNE